MLTEGTIPSLFNGVSQQAPASRLTSQGEIQENGLSSIVDGLGKRPPTNHVAKVSPFKPDNALVHLIDRGPGSRFMILAHNAWLWAVNADTGAKYPITFETSNSYLDCPNPATDLRAVTVGDDTVILNRFKRVLRTWRTQAPRVEEALVNVLAGNYSQKFSVTVGTNVVEFTTAASDVTQTDVAYIARKLSDSLKTSLTSSCIVYQIPSTGTVYIRSVDGSSFNVTATDSQGGHSINAITSYTTKFSNLPEVARNGFTTRISGDPASGIDDYWVRFKTLDAANEYGKGVWIECVAPGANLGLYQPSVPHLLSLKYIGGTPTFTFKQAPWRYREVGDEDTNPDPSILGNYVADIFLYRNRLGLIAGPNVVLSKVGDYFDLYRDSAREVVDSDPIDVKSSDPRISYLRHAVPFNEGVLLAGDRAQCILRGSDTLTPKTVQITPTTAYEMDPNCKPTHAEAVVFIPVSSVGKTNVLEYVVDYSGPQQSATPITEHVPRYLLGRPLQMSASSVENHLTVVTDGENALYVYRWEFSSRDRVQSAWSKWTFGAKVLGSVWSGSQLFVSLVRCDGVYLERIDLNYTEDAHSNYLTMLDRRITESSVHSTFDATHNWTKVTLPYRRDPSGVVAVTRDIGSDNWVAGRVVPSAHQSCCEDFTSNGSGESGDSGGISPAFVIGGGGGDSGCAGRYYKFQCTGSAATLVAVVLPNYADLTDIPTLAEWVTDGSGNTVQWLYGCEEDGPPSGVMCPESSGSDGGGGSGVPTDPSPPDDGGNPELPPSGPPPDPGTDPGVPRPPDVPPAGPGETLTPSSEPTPSPVDPGSGPGTGCSCDSCLDSSLYLAGNWVGQPMWFGQSYTFRYRFSEVFVRTPTTTSNLPVADQQARLQLNRFGINYRDTGHLTVSVLAKYRDPVSSSITGRTLGSLETPLSTVPIVTGSRRFPVMARSNLVAIELTNSTHLPCWITSADWEAWYEPRQRRF